MGPAYEVEVVLVQELGDNLGSECEGDPPVILAPAHRVLHRIALLIPLTTIPGIGSNVSVSVIL
jgi:hypothetical protein